MSLALNVPITRKDFWQVLHQDPVFIPWLKEVVSYLKIKSTYYDGHSSKFNPRIHTLLGIIITICIDPDTHIPKLNPEDHDLNYKWHNVWASPVHTTGTDSKWKNPLQINPTVIIEGNERIVESLYITRCSEGYILNLFDIQSLIQGRVIIHGPGGELNDCCMYVTLDELLTEKYA